MAIFSPRAGIRVEQLEDTLEIIKQMWSEPGPVSYQGKRYSVTNAYCEPKPGSIPPIIVGGGGRKTMLLAARYANWWNIPDANFTTYRECVSILKEHCVSINRDPASLRLTWFGRLAVGNNQAEAEALSDGKWTRDNALVGTPAQVVEQLQQFIELGVDYFMVKVLGLSNRDIGGMVLEEVLPKVT